MRVITNNPETAYRTRLEELEARLDHGDAMIRQMEAENKPTDHLVRYWLELLSQYEAEYRAEKSAA